MKKFKIISCLLFISIILLSTGCKKDNMEDIDIMVTNYPTEYILTELYGEHANIKSVYPDGVIINSYKIPEKRKKDISKEELFVYTGLIDRESKLAVELLDLNGNLKIIDTSYILEIENSEEELWLNPSYLLMMAKNIEMGLDEYINSSYLKKEIKSNYEKLKVELSELDADFRVNIENSKNKTIVVNNKNLKFLEKLGLNVIVLDDKATDKTYDEVDSLISNDSISYIFKFKDEKNSEKVDKIIENHSSIKTLELNRIENLTDKERDDKENYITLMKKNLETIKQEIY